ncbi:MAG: hypothetical protein HYR96_11840 [Deltaproteobacteria bacterium]|nr:hypothetical protein [Deltaproteobacteria bacterium]MBI3294532.1 hypothetical protein [Deltaproteobacteria bacterium]
MLTEALIVLGRVLNFTLLSVFVGLCLVSPGLWVCDRFEKKLNPALRIPLLAATVGILGYVAFFAYWMSPLLGKVMSAVVIVASLGWGVPRLRRGLGDLGLPLLLVLVAPLFYNALNLKGEPRDSGALAAREIGGFHMPHDNFLPFMLAEKLAHGEDARMLDSDWHGSDRPPLQAGVFLLVRPLADLPGLHAMGYQVTGCLLQAFWILALFFLGRALGRTDGAIGTVFLILLLSGFCYLNTIYVWPKLLAASFFILGLSLWLFHATALPALAGALVGLALLSHGGSAFPTLGLGVLMLRDFSWKRVLLFAAAAGALLMPWYLYKGLYDPPGNRLEKMHLAGTEPADSRSTGRAIIDAYSETPLHTIVEYKARNLARLWNAKPFSIWVTGPLLSIREAQFFSLFHTLGILNIGLVLLLLGLGGREWRILGLLCGVTLALWITLLFGPDGAVLHQGSYVLPLLVLIGSAFCLIDVLGRWAWVLVLGQGMIFFTVWSVFLPLSWFPGGAVWVTVSTAALCGILHVVCGRSQKQSTFGRA